MEAWVVGTAEELAFCICDLGATSTDVALFVSGIEQQRAQWEPCKPNATGLHEDVLIQKLYEWLPKDIPPAMVLGVAGVYTDREVGIYQHTFVNTWRETTKSELPAIRVVSDAELACNAAFGTADGIVVIVGTGSIVLKRHNGTLLRSGGYGVPMGDPGSGMWLGTQAVCRVMDMIDAVGPETLLIRPVAAAMRLAEHQIDAIRLSLRTFPWQRASRLAPAVLSYASEGDPIATGIVEQATSVLAKQVGTMYQKPLTIALHGSVATSELFSKMFINNIHRVVGNVPIEFVNDVLLETYQQLRFAGNPPRAAVTP
jgi:N-acetylglucosamine kinase-like BadF-type ATPase